MPQPPESDPIEVFVKIGKPFYLAVIMPTYLTPDHDHTGSDNAEARAATAESGTLEDRNMNGGNATMPPFSDCVIDFGSSLRQVILSNGIALPDISIRCLNKSPEGANVAGNDNRPTLPTAPALTSRKENSRYLL